MHRHNHKYLEKETHAQTYTDNAQVHTYKCAHTQTHTLQISFTFV